MSWEHRNLLRGSYLYQTRTQPSTLGINKRCFIRKEHECGKLFGASKSCFIACPTSDTIEPILNLISEKLSRNGVEPIIAVKERAYGQDIFCTKICGKIIESRFCLVILDDSIINENNIPNPNVYYEYGLMTSLGKHIIPLQKDGQKLGFNIQSYDTIKYSNTNVSIELDRAFRDAFRLSEEKNTPIEIGEISEKSMFRRFELSGLQEIDHKNDEEMIDVFSDTQFKGFIKSEDGSYIFLGKIDSEEDFTIYLEDFDIVMFRIENMVKQAENSIEPLSIKIEQSRELLSNITRSRDLPIRNVEERERSREIEMLVRRMSEISNRIARCSEIWIGFINNNELDSTNFRSKIIELASQHTRYQCAFSSGGELSISNISIDLRTHQ